MYACMCLVKVIRLYTRMYVCVYVLSYSVVSDSVTLWTVAHQTALSTGILQARILEWVALPSSRDLPNPGIEPRSPSLQVDSLPAEGSPYVCMCICVCVYIFTYIYQKIYVHIFFFRCFSLIGYYTILSVVACAIHSVLVVYVLYTVMCIIC